ncbi:DNA repair exonuclease, partial [Paenibacillus sepulcri]|nr:DNA repair exonuclease [Paenibacillus sepulcri]
QVEHSPAYRKDGELAAYVYGMSYGARAVTDNIARGYRPDPEGPYHIALLHGNVDGNPAYDPYAPCSLTELASSGFDYWALGHIHTRAVLHTYPHVVYPGNTQGRHFRETGAKGCYIVDVKPSREAELTFVALDTVRWERIEASIEGVENEQAMLDLLER